jgi:tripartite-type tricarboxylate transporter receptor subunit TctC
MKISFSQAGCCVSLNIKNTPNARIIAGVFKKTTKETPMLTRRSLAAATLAMPFLSKASFAQSFPSTIRLIVGFPPGGSVDAMARFAAPHIQEITGSTVVVENKPGGSGSIGASNVAKSANDGSNWLFVFDTQAINPTLIPNLNFDSFKDLDPVALIGTAPMTIACKADKPFKTFADVIAAASKPEGVNYGSISTGSLGHLTMTLVAKKLNIKLNHIPYRGGGPLTNDVVAGHVDLGIASAAQFASQVEGKTITAVSQTSGAIVNNVAPISATKGLEGVIANAWWGVFAPAGTSKALTDKINMALIKAYNEPKNNKILTQDQQVTLALKGADELRAFFAKEVALWGQVIKENNIKSE